MVADLNKTHRPPAAFGVGSGNPRSPQAESPASGPQEGASVRAGGEEPGLHRVPRAAQHPEALERCKSGTAASGFSDSDRKETSGLKEPHAPQGSTSFFGPPKHNMFAMVQILSKA